MKTKFKQTEIGKIPEDWEVKKLGETLLQIIDGDRGVNYPKQNEFYKKGYCLFLNTKNVPNDKFNFQECSFITKEKDNLLRKGKLFRGDIVLTTRGTIGNLALFSDAIQFEVIRINSGMVIIRNNANIFDTNFLYLLLRSPIIQNQFKSVSTGSAQPQLPVRDLNKVNLVVPPLQEQRAIAKILSDLDDKIELLQKQNKTLEKIGQAIFKHWFVDFEFPDENGKPYKSSGGEMVKSEMGEIPKGWGVGKLGDLLENIKDSLKSGGEIENRMYVPIDLLSIRKLSVDSFLPYTKAKSSLIGFEKNDILLGAMRVYFHRVNLAPFQGVTRSTTFVLRPIKGYFLSYALFLLNQDETINYANLHSRGSTMPYAVWNSSLENMSCYVPREEKLKEFHKIIYPMLCKIRDSIFQNQTLLQIRNALLPKLMSGEIRVK